MSFGFHIQPHALQANHFGNRCDIRLSIQPATEDSAACISTTALSTALSRLLRLGHRDPGIQVGEEVAELLWVQILNFA